MNDGPRVLVISDDDDVSEPLAILLTRSGYRVGVCSGNEGLEELHGPAPDAVCLDRDLPESLYQEAIRLLEKHAGRASFPLLILGGGASPVLPRGWHEDAALSIARPPQPGEALARLAALRRLVFYRAYRDLVHDISQPITTIHALTRTIAKSSPGDEAARSAIDLLLKEADRLMTLVEEFQRKKAAAVNLRAG